MKIKVGINGFGRRGRCLCRVLLKHEEFQIVAINDPFLTATEMVCFGTFLSSSR